MAYVGPAPKLGQNREVDDISSGFNGSTTAFTLQVDGSNVSPGSATSIIVSVNNVIQNPNTDYTISGSTITFSSAPTNGHAFFAVVLNQGVDTSVPANGSVTTAKLGDDAVTYTKMQNVSATDRLLGRDSSGAGIVEEIAPSAVRTMLGLATSATTDTTNASNIGSGTLAAARVATLNQDTTGTAAIATTVTTADESSDTTCFPLFATAATGNLAPKTGSNLAFNSSNGTLTATSFSGDGSNLTGITSTTINNNADNRIITGSGSANTLNGEGNFTFDGSDLSLVGEMTITASATSTQTVEMKNNENNASGDFQLKLKTYSNGGADPYIRFDAGGTDMVVGTSYQGTTANLLCLGPGSSPSSSNDGFIIDGVGKATLRAHLTGQEPVLTIRNDRTRADGHMYGLDFRDDNNESNANIVIRQGSSGNNAGSMRFYINSGTGGNGLTNGIFCAQFSQSGHFLPGVNNTNDLGSSSYRWRNIYTSDLNMSNEDSSNDVDGTWGSYTIQEGAEDLFLINRRNGKKYKFNLTEVS